MKVSKSWLKELVELKISIDEVEKLLPLRTIGTKEITENFIELDMKGYNRADLLSMRGVAREVAAITDSEIKFTEVPHKDYVWVEQSLPELKVEVEDDKLCPIYCVAKIEGLKVGGSPKDWVKKLEDCGIRSINNIADLTNLMMLEYGQTMHSFDAAKVADETMIVRLAKEGEQFETLDGKNRILTSEDLLITDPKGILSLSGIMGGKDSEITEDTDSILLEVAIFDPVSIRKTGQRLGLHSEASKRIQHGLTRKGLFQALDAAIKMYQDLGGKLTALTIVGETEDQIKKVPLTLEKTNSLIGVDLSKTEVEDFLKKLNFEMEEVEEGRWVVTPPYYRLDIEIEEDLIEETARMYGYEKIPAKELAEELPEKIDQSLFDLIYNTKKSLVDLGLTEIQSYSFYSTKVLGALGFDESNKENIIRVANPISSETEYLREFIWPNLVEVIEKNLKQGYGDIAIFEVGKVYLPPSTSLRGSDSDRGNLPIESYRLAIALMNSSDNPVKELNTIFSLGANLFHPPGVQVEKGGLMKELKTLFHPTRFATVKLADKVIGGLAEVHPRLLNHFGIDKKVAILEISIERPN